MIPENPSPHHQDDPCNRLEHSLLAVTNGEIAKEEFLREFLGAQLYILIDGEPEGDTLGNRLPLVFAESPESARLLALFSSPGRAKSLMDRFADYRFLVLVDCIWALSHLGPHMGLALNPGCDLGFELAPAGAQQLKLALEQASNPQSAD